MKVYNLKAARRLERWRRRESVSLIIKGIPMAIILLALFVAIIFGGTILFENITSQL
jgi:hypothetical protein